MNVIESLRDQAARNPKRIIFPESCDPRVIEAANIFQRDGLGNAVVVSDGLIADLDPSVECVSPQEPELREAAIQQLIKNRQHRGMDRQRAIEALSSPLLFAALLVKTGFVAGSVAGSVATTANVIRAGIYGVGPVPGRRLVSSYFLMQLPERAMTYADCGVVPDPDAEQLAEIAVASAESHHKLTGEQPRVAMLSFSTKDSASHPRVDKVKRALSIAKQLNSELSIDGELQFDAAFDRAVGERKAPDSTVAGRANVFVFPDLDSGNIAYKITERVGGATALGPLIQGLAKPCMDLSRGCRAGDIVDVAVIASMVAE